MSAENHELRMRLLDWVQIHFIRHYEDGRVLSHSESVEQLCALIENRPVPVMWDPVAGELHPAVDGPCDQFSEDGRSTICTQCDWPEEQHAIAS